MLKEFPEQNKAVVVNSDGSVIRQLASPKIRPGYERIWSDINSILNFPTKKEALKIAKHMHITSPYVKKINLPMGFYAWVLKYDPLFDYYYACWK